MDWQCIGSAFVFQLKCSSVIAMCGLLQFVYLTPVETHQSGPHSTLFSPVTCETVLRLVWDWRYLCQSIANEICVVSTVRDVEGRFTV